MWRRRQGRLSSAEKLDFIRAIQCFAEKKPLTPPELAPGVRSRYDDFVATHINQTLSIHATANFLGWHRYYIWTFEKALKEECGYLGQLPYWSWGKYASDPAHSPIFDGSETSLGGDGSHAPYGDLCIPNCETPNYVFPAGNGGGCVTSGPFKNWTVNLGPVSSTMPGINPNPQSDGLGYNPRCLRRDINQHISSSWTKDNDTAWLIREHDDIGAFQRWMQGVLSSKFFGVHAGGHMTIGGDPGGDLFASPGDPAFYLHHSQIDRVWWIWQNLDPQRRTHTIAGTITIEDIPPSRNGTLDDFIDLGVNAPPMQLRNALSTTEGPFCYIYG
ncbi:Tyrosinase [Macrophomina phaseolina MS6]|uniref:Tyrosinase n=1 Tax=Macrophomina phaseolina (strain MS6) TaxID=1126212 RepID=K2S416_MACPH|nr:Tyrosinase [Macrophomina phaseolina MS6]